MNIQFKLAMRYLSSRKLRTFLTTLAVIFGVMILFGMSGLIKPILDAFRSIQMTTAGVVDMTITQVDGISFYPNELTKVKNTAGVAAVTGILRQNMMIPTSLSGTMDPLQGATSLSVNGIDPATADSVRSYPVTGNFLTAGKDDQMLVPEAVAKKLNLSIGSIMKLPSAKGTASFTVVGFLSQRLTLSDEAYITLPAAQRLFDEPGQINVMEVLFSAGTTHATVENAILANLGSNFQQGIQESGGTLYASAKLGEIAINLFGILAIAMGGFIIYNTFRTILVERRRDLGMLRAVGASRKTVMGVFLYESLIQGVAGTAIGMLLGYLLALAMIQSIQPYIGQYIHIRIGSPSFTPINYVLSVVMGIGITVFSAVFPARQAAQITPMEALRPIPAATYEKAARRRAIIGAVLVGLALLGLFSGLTNLLGLATLIFLAGIILIAPALVTPVARIFSRLFDLIFKREGNIAQGNLIRQPSRAAVTASSMMIGLAIMVTLIGMVTSISDGFLKYLDRSLGADYIMMPTSLVLSGGNVGASPDLAQSLSKIPGIAGITTLRLGISQTKGNALQLIGIDPATYAKVAGLTFSSGNEKEAYAALANGRALIVNGIFSAQNQVKVGDVLTLRTANGDQSYQVAAIGLDYLNAKLATAYISQANLENDFHQTADLMIMINRTASADPTATFNAINAIIKDYPSFTLIDYTSFRKTQESSFNGAMSILYIMVFVLVIPGLIAMVNTLAINVIERTREFGVLRAIGSTKRQVRRMVLAESLLLGAFGTSLGVLVGIWLGYALVQALNLSGFIVTYFFPLLGIVVAIAAGLLFGVLAATVPARQAAKMNIIEALRYE
jgi:putative ABC transport system permease protein